ncbi:MAG: MGMT family protein [Bacteroidetes bacterium]|nr:MAG: MGMT family protein [Bacteroidota bacterium]
MKTKPGRGKHDYRFFEDVYEVVKLIPAGRVSTYGAIARYLGAARSARMVGYAMNKCMDRPDVPAHRVVNRNGMLTGRHHFSPEFPMDERLRREGVQVVDDQVQEFEKRFWDPQRELL